MSQSRGRRVFAQQQAGSLDPNPDQTFQSQIQDQAQFHNVFLISLPIYCNNVELSSFT
jgi:hypothetical protein